MNKLSAHDRARILCLLCAGNNIPAVTRLTGASKNTVIKLLFDAGMACAAYHNEHVRNVKATHILCDKIWSFTFAKQINLASAKVALDGAEDTWTWTALDADTKMIVSYFVGGRDSKCAMALMNDLRQRVATRAQLTTDGHKACLNGADEGRYSPAESIGAKKEPVNRNPDRDEVSTSISKKVVYHAQAVALHVMYYNFLRIHSKLHISPALAAGISDRLWDIGDIVALVEAQEVTTAPKVRDPYKNRAAAVISN